MREDSTKSQWEASNHVICNVKTEDSSFVVDENGWVGGEGRHSDVQHVVDLGGQREGRGGEGRLLVLPNVIKFPLNNKNTRNRNCRKGKMRRDVENMPRCANLQAEVNGGCWDCGWWHHRIFNLCVLIHPSYNYRKLQRLSHIKH